MESLTVILGLIAGGLGYLIVNFWMNPILGYLKIRHAVTSDLIFYANAISVNDPNEEMKTLMADRRKANRKHASELTAVFFRLPWWYKICLKRRKEDPVSASKKLIGLSNITASIPDADGTARTFIGDLKKHLVLPDNLEV
jgi:hypothetical protein